jgi:hypothetical protein
LAKGGIAIDSVSVVDAHAASCAAIDHDGDIWHSNPATHAVVGMG